MHVLVVAHGPRPVTKKAVARIRRWGELAQSIHVIPASPAARPGRGMFPGASVVDEIGSAGVRSVLNSLGDEDALVLHDDLAITRKGVEIMVGERASADFVVPYSNEHGMATSIGVLPAAAVAETTLDASARLLQRRPLLEARHACLLARASDLIDLGGSLVMPGSTLTRADISLVAAPCAAAHDLSCNTRFVDDALDSKVPLLVASMIVRDEEPTLPGALASIEGLVDRIEIFDTGSIDDTIGVVRAFGGIVSQIEWRNDFGWARTTALEACRDAEFVLMFDADERVHVDDKPLFRRWLRTWSHEIDGLLVDVQSARGDGGGHTSNASCRIARASGARFDGAIHEALTVTTRTGGTDTNILFHRGMKITHDGYLPEVIEAKAKPERNVAIARTAHETSGDLKSMIDLARSLRMVDPDDPEAEALFREALASLDVDERSQTRSFLRAVVASYELDQGNTDDAIEMARDALEETPGEDVALVTIGHALTAEQRFADLVDVHRDLSVRADGNPLFRVPRNVLRYQSYVGRSLLHTGDVDEGRQLLVEALEQDSEGVADTVAIAVAEALSSGFPPEWIVPLVVADSSGLIIDVVARNVQPLLTATLCHAALELGGSNSALFTTLVTAALVAGDHDLASKALGFLDRADGESLSKLADLAQRKGHLELAQALERSSGCAVVGAKV